MPPGSSEEASSQRLIWIAGAAGRVTLAEAELCDVATEVAVTTTPTLLEGELGGAV